MKIIISPAKRMHQDIAYLSAKRLPVFIKEASILVTYIQTLSVEDMKDMLACNDSIAQEAYQAYQHMDLREQVVPALLSYDGIQYTYMAPSVFIDEYFTYVDEHVRILSGLYGILRPLDGVVPYRLELNNSFHTPFCTNLYEYWKDRLYLDIVKEDTVILDLASTQYSRIIKKYADENVRIVKCYFMEEEEGTLREKGVYVKMARGEMVRFLAEQGAEDVEVAKQFRRLRYHFAASLSDENKFVFVRKEIRKTKLFPNHNR